MSLGYLAQACRESEWSDDPRTQNGAVLVSEDGVVVSAVNCLPPGVQWTPARRADKYRWIEHAERAVIYKAAASGVRTAGATLYAPWFACHDCARAIVMAGIAEVVGHALPRSLTPDRWLEAVVGGEEILREAGVGLRWVGDPLGVSMLFDGRRIHL